MKYICELCGTCYDELTGDPHQNIPAGTSFSDLPAHYECPCCGSEREAFSPIDGQVQAAIRQNGDNRFWQYAKYTDEHHSSER